MEPDGTDSDAHQIYLRHSGMPSLHWHLSALLRVVAKGCYYSPWRKDGLDDWGIALKRHVAVTSAAAQLYQRGYDMDAIVRRGLGGNLLGAIVDVAVRAAVDLAHQPELAVPIGAQVLGRMLASTSTASIPSDPTAFLLQVAETDLYRAFTRRVAGWILCWRLPGAEDWAKLPEADLVEDPDAAWVLDRFLATYLSDWGTPSLHAEYRWKETSHATVLPEAELRLRDVPRDRLNGEIARRAVLGDRADTVEFRQLQEQTLEHLEAGEHDLAVALVRGALFSSPRSPALRNNLAFCLIPGDPRAARDLLASLVHESVQPALTLANKATAEMAMGDFGAAGVTLDALSEAPSPEWPFTLWDLRRRPLELARVDAPYDYVPQMFEDLLSP